MSQTIKKPEKVNPMWPFYGPKYGDLQTIYTSADDRLNAVRRMDHKHLAAALLVPGLQKTVELAIHARLKTMGEN